MAVIKRTMSETRANERYNMALNYINNAIKVAVGYKDSRNGRTVEFKYTAVKEHTSKVFCSQEDAENPQKLKDIARQYISGEKSHGISIAFDKKRDSSGKRQTSIAINWAEIYHRFFESNKYVYC